METLNYADELKLRNSLITNYDNSFIMAGAGAGKTFTLVNRIVNHIKSGADVSQMVAISFTNKSAEDLKERIIDELNKARKKQANPQELMLIENALNKIDTMHISTIHKFCGDILKENSIFAKISPGFKIAVNEDELSVIEDVFNNFINKNINQKELEIIKNLFSKKKTVISDIKRLYYELIKHIDKLEKKDIFGYQEVDYQKALSNSIGFKAAFISFVNEFNDNLSHLVNVSNSPTSGKTTSTNSATDIVKKDFKEYIDFNTLHISYKDISSFYNKIKVDAFCPFNSNKFKGNKKIELDAFLDNISGLILKISSIKEDNQKNYRAFVVSYAYRAYLLYLEHLEQDFDSVTNNELLVITKQLLSSNKEVKEKLQKKYRYIYIDEYQDTDHVQRDIALLLTQDDNHKFLRDSALFLVGDPKQSIYRFRGAEPQIYYETKTIYDQNSAHELNINFRSNSKILDYVNYIYDTNTNPNGITLTKEPYSRMLVKKINEISNEECSKTENLLGFYKTSDVSEENIAKIIKHLKKNYKLRDVIKDQNDNDQVIYRDIKYSDFMVLMHNHSYMSNYISVFSANKIPSKVAGESDFHSIYQIRMFISLFESLNTLGTIAIQMAYEVFKILYADKFANKTEKESEEICLKLFNDLKAKVSGMSSYGMAIYLINNLNWITKNGEKMEAFESNSVKSKLYQMVEEVFTSDYLNGKQAAKSFKDYVNNLIEYESLIDNNADAVSVINVHKSKGLEAPIVIYVCKKGQDGSKTQFVDGKLYICEDKVLDYYNDNQSVAKQIEEENMLEKARLEYVAATRAKEAFILVSSSEDYKLFKNDIYFNNEYIRDFIMPEQKDNSDDSYQNNASDENVEYVTYLSTTYETNFDKPSLIVTSPSSKENDSIIRKKLYDEAINNEENVESNRPKGNILGSILHKAFELLVLARKNNRIVDYNELFNSAYLEFAELVEESKKDEYETFIKTCLNNLDKYYSDIKLYENDLYPELKFCLKKNDEISNGSIDLLAVESDKITIYDYKSDVAEYIKNDDVFEQTLTEKYQNQLNDYELVVKELYDLPIAKKIIYFRRYDKEKKSIDVKVFELK